MADLVYPPVIATAKLGFRLIGLKLTMTGTQHVPRSGGAVLASTHVSYLDFLFVGLSANPSRRLVRFMAKRQVFSHPISGPLMRGMHHISVDRQAGSASYDEALAALRRGEVIGMFPEATISRSFTVKELKTGAARLAIETGVPLIPVTVWGTQRIWTKGRPRNFRQRGIPVTIAVGEPIPTAPGDEPIKLTDVLAERMQDLLSTVQREYPDRPAGTDDSWWLPAALGGAAPTVAQAREMDAAESHLR